MVVNFLHRGMGLLQRAGLLFGAAGQIVGAHGDFGAGRGHRGAAAAHLGHHAGQAFLHGLELRHHAAGVAGLQAHLAAQIAGGHAARQLHRLMRLTTELARDRARNRQRQRQGQQQGQGSKSQHQIAHLSLRGLDGHVGRSHALLVVVHVFLQAGDDQLRSRQRLRKHHIPGLGCAARQRQLNDAVIERSRCHQRLFDGSQLGATCFIGHHV